MQILFCEIQKMRTSDSPKRLKAHLILGRSRKCLCFFLGVRKGGIVFVQWTLFKFLQISTVWMTSSFKRCSFGKWGCAGTQDSHLTWQKGRQRNGNKVRVAAFSAIFVLFEFRWVMWSCCLSARLSLGQPSLPHPTFFFTQNCQMSPTATSKSFWVRCCLK